MTPNTITFGLEQLKAKDLYRGRYTDLVLNLVYADEAPAWDDTLGTLTKILQGL